LWNKACGGERRSHIANGVNRNHRVSKTLVPER
jgi:hypothetical protein